MGYGRVVVLTGAGVSAESGVHTFRDAGGLWEGHRVEDVATPQAFARNPQLVQGFYNARRRQLAEVRPNAAHHALADCARRMRGEGRRMWLVTQNVDDLHERAGSGGVLHMHGSLRRARCLDCHRSAAVDGDLGVGTGDDCPHCASERRRPDIVWFGEMPHHLDTIWRVLARCDCFVAIGTSGQVYPAAGFVAAARAAGAHCVLLNLDAAANGGLFHQTLSGPATATTPEFCAAL